MMEHRQGVLPYPEFWASTKPFGTPLGPCLISWFMTFLMIVAPPAGDAFQFGKLSTCTLRNFDYQKDPYD